MKKTLIILFTVLVLIGCGKKDQLALGEYDERNYQNETFNLDVDIPEGFSYLTKEELDNVNAGLAAESQNPEAAKYRNLVLNVEHLDGVKMIAFVDAFPDSQKNKEAEANKFLDFLTAQEIDYDFDKSEKDINGVNYLQLDLDLPFDQKQTSYITVKDNKLINIQINYEPENSDSAQELFDMYE